MRIFIERNIMMIKTVCLLLLASILFVSCASAQTDAADTAAVTDAVEESAVETEAMPDIGDDVSFDGATFTFGVVENANARNTIVIEEINGEVLNDAQYDAVANTNQKLNVNIEQFVMTSGYPAASALTPIITAGDDVIQVANVFCVDAVMLLGSNYILGYENVPYIDLSRPYWDSSVSDSLTFCGMRYAAIGDLSISTHDLTYILLFSTALIEQNNLASPYELINSGKWTMDKMKETMETVITDTNGNGIVDKEDTFGYLSAAKMTLPSFWIGAGEKTLEMNDEGVPQLAIEDDRFISVLEKVYEMTYDINARYNSNNDSDVPSDNRQMFAANQSLFMDCSMFWIGTLRDMETDFGIIPYPKYDEDQDEYYSRVSYYMPPVLPMTNTDLELTGAVLETANYYAGQNVTPAYYDITLKGKYSRDEESIAMLDLIFNNRVVDLGDTLFCADIRDAFMSTMYSSNNRDFISQFAAKLTAVNNKIEKTAASIREAMAAG